MRKFFERLLVSKREIKITHDETVERESQLYKLRRAHHFPSSDFQIYHSWFAHFLGHKMNCIPHLIPKNGVKLQENRVHPPPIFGGVKSREEPLFSHKKLLELSENKGIFL